jgi:DNA-binding transcriptional ArsR family regulator
MPERPVPTPDVFSAIADPTRRRLLDLLSESESPVTVLARRFAVSRPAISQHLRILRDAGLVTERRSGRQRLYRLRPQPLRQVYDWAAHYQRFWHKKLRSLGRHLGKDL